MTTVASLDERMRRALRVVRGQLADVRGEADSRDGQVWAAVNGYGQLVDLWLADDVYRDPDANALADKIDQTTREAARAAADEAYRISRRALAGEGLS